MTDRNVASSHWSRPRAGVTIVMRGNRESASELEPAGEVIVNDYPKPKPRPRKPSPVNLSVRCLQRTDGRDTSSKTLLFSARSVCSLARIFFPLSLRLKSDPPHTARPLAHASILAP